MATIRPVHCRSTVDRAGRLIGRITPQRLDQVIRDEVTGVFIATRNDIMAVAVFFLMASLFYL